MCSDSLRIIFYVAISQALPYCIPSFSRAFLGRGLQPTRVMLETGAVDVASRAADEAAIIPLRKCHVEPPALPQFPPHPAHPRPNGPGFAFQLQGELKQHSNVFCLLCSPSSCMTEGSGLWISQYKSRIPGVWAGIRMFWLSRPQCGERPTGCCVSQEGTKHSLVCRNITKIPN